MFYIKLLINSLSNHRALVHKRHRFVSECAQNPRLASFPHSGPPYNSVVYLTDYSIFSHPCMLTFYNQGHLTHSRPTPTPSPSGHSPSFTLHNIAHTNLPLFALTSIPRFQIHFQRPFSNQT